MNQLYILNEHEHKLNEPSLLWSLSHDPRFKLFYTKLWEKSSNLDKTLDDGYIIVFW